jgi:hypothetical protein
VRHVALILAWVLLATPAQAITFTPIARASALGGQYFTGSTHSTGANIDWNFVPVIGLTPKLFLIPIYIGSYKETQSVYNFLGENTLIQRQLSQTGFLRMAWAVESNWRIKPRVGYKKEWIKQSTDGSLSGGLFNYNRFNTGVSAERVIGNGAVEFGYEYGITRYPNYQALDADPRLTTTGITGSAGTNVLDFDTHEFSASYQLGSADKRWVLNHSLTWLRQNFVDQKVITTTEGGFEDFVDKLRTDDIFNLAFQQNFRPTANWGFGMGETFQYYISNQNAFDATQLFVNPFTYRYYNFFDVQTTPSVTRYFKEGRWETTLSGNFGFKKYSYRRTQDGFGTYENKLIYSYNRGASVTVRYRFFKDFESKWLKGLSAILTGSVLTYKSNTRYEVNYPYNYSVYNYLGGLSWEF